MQWNDVVKVKDTANEEPKKDSITAEWGTIFKLKEKVTVTFLDNGSYKLVDTDKADTDEVKAIGLNDLKALEKLVQDLDCKDLTVNAVNNFKVVFEVDGKVKIGNNTNAFTVVDKANFERFLKALDALKQCIDFDPKITLNVDDDVKIGEQKVKDTFAKSESFWKSVKNHVALFDSLGTNQLVITNESQNVKIGNFQTVLPIKTVCEDFNTAPVVFKDGWSKIFKKN